MKNDAIERKSIIICYMVMVLSVNGTWEGGGIEIFIISMVSFGEASKSNRSEKHLLLCVVGCLQNHLSGRLNEFNICLHDIILLLFPLQNLLWLWTLKMGQLGYHFYKSDNSTHFISFLLGSGSDFRDFDFSSVNPTRIHGSLNFV